MERNIIVYFGIIQYEYNNAMCQHAEGVKALIKASGYIPVIIGVSPKVSRGSINKIDKFTYVVNDPQNLCDVVKECVSAKDILRVLNDVGLDKIKSVIMADFRFLPMRSVFKFCKKHNINFVINVMDRFVAGKDIVSKIKKIDSELRMKYLYPKIERRIYICSAYNELLGEGEYTAVIPGVTYEQHELNKEREDDEKINLVFLGQPGLRCEKEKIDWVIKAIFEKGLTDKFKLSLAGFDKEKFFNLNPEIREYIAENIQFFGRVKHKECLDLLKTADFSLVIRPDTMLSKYGFSTKIGEAFSCGVPVLTTDTSDNKLYISDGNNGFVCGCTYTDVSAMLERVSNLTFLERCSMKKYICSNNPLDFQNFIKLFSKSVTKD